jgi:putative DNA primase/helicase
MTSDDDRLAAALAYADRGWPVFPVAENKHPITAHGLSDATLDKGQIETWFDRWPRALIAIATGERSGIVALDIDIDAEMRINGFDALEELGIATHPISPSICTPRGGCHVLFAWPGHFVKTIAGRMIKHRNGQEVLSGLGVGLDIRGDGGSLILPPAPGRIWDPHLALDAVPIAPMPAWMVVKEPEAEKPRERSNRSAPISSYGEAALNSAMRAIIDAAAGSQRDTLNRECYSIGQLVAGLEIPADIAVEDLLWAATRMQSHDPRRPWKSGQAAKMAKEALIDGQRSPRSRGR